jgi:hypothetical protein
MDLDMIRSFGLGLLLVSGMLVSSAGGDGIPVVVTTDTPEYCQKLFDRLSQVIQAATAPPPVEVASLSTEGERMCSDGLTRGGILRLRRALLILEQRPAARIGDAQK